MSLPSVVFNAAAAADVLHAACSQVGLSSADARLIRLGENALYALDADPVVVRIARGHDRWADAVKEVAVAEWLAANGIRAAEPWDVPQPRAVDGHPVTFWRLIDGRRGGPSDVGELASVLRRIHRLSRPALIDLPQEEALARVVPRIEAAELPSDHRAVLLRVCAELQNAVAGLRFPLAESVVHGDAHVQNLMVDDAGVVVIDFERVSFGQPEWDLAMTATEYVSAGFWTAAQYQRFAEVYGFDVMTWDGFDVLRRVHELKMTTWLMQNIGESADVRAEYERRMAAIRTGRSTAPWRAF